MKMLAAIVAFTALLPSHAFAQYGVRQDPYRAYGQQIRPRADFYNSYGYYNSYGPYGVRRSVNRAFDVYDDRGEYVGSDPDPQVRSMLAHDPPYRD